MSLYHERSAIVSDDELYRYLLTRGTPARDFILWIMLNPSVADDIIDDPTIKKVCGFSERWKFSYLKVVNLFALRSTDPRNLLLHANPEGPDNDRHLQEQIRDAHTIICAWGNHGILRDRDLAVRQMIADAGKTPSCLKLNKELAPGRRAPQHPLYIPYETSPFAWPRS